MFRLNGYLSKLVVLSIVGCIFSSTSTAQKAYNSSKAHKASKTPKLSEANIYQESKKNPSASILPDFSYAGYHYGEDKLPNITKNVLNVLNFGVKPNVKEDQTQAVQALIDKLGKQGGGVVFFPKGKYYFNLDSNNKQHLAINYSNVVLRGEGSSEQGTILYNGNDLAQFQVSPWLSPAFIQTSLNLQHTLTFWGIDYPDSVQLTKAISTNAGVASDTIQKATIVAQITQAAEKGQRNIQLSNTNKLHAGSVILIGMFNTTKDGNLIKDILQPIEAFETYETAALEAGKMASPSFQSLVEVEAVLPNNFIRLKQPLRRNISLIYRPVVALAPMLMGIGIENLRLESNWDGNYCHHGCDKTDPKQGKIMDYGYTGINLCRATHSWIKDVSFHNFTNPVYILDSRNCTVTSLDISGFDAHSGIKIYSHASDNLISNIRFHNNFTHVLSGEGCAYGNVFTDIVYTPVSKKLGYFDFHGFSDRRFSPSSQNLFENIIGLQQVNSGGAPNYMPQTATNNVWWNIELGKNPIDNKEFFYCWAWDNKEYSKKSLTEHYKQYPKSILVGVFGNEYKTTINGKEGDMDTPWIYAEQMNQGKVWPISLYQAQLERRLKKK